MFGRKDKDRDRDIITALSAVDAIRNTDNIHDADIMTGFALGVIAQKIDSCKLSYRLGSAITHVAKKVNDSHRRELMEIAAEQ